MSVQFITPEGLVRPVRLSEQTRRFAYESLHAKYGRETREMSAVCMDDTPDWDALSDLEKYNQIVRSIATECPIRICEGEKISGSATLGAAIDHTVPATYKGRTVFFSVSHLTLDYETTLQIGLNGIRMQVEKSLTLHKEKREKDFLRSCLSVLDSFFLWHNRYLSALQGNMAYRENYEGLTQVPFLPARSFKEALQSIWMVFAFNRLCGNWPGIGRMDAMLGKYLKKDLQEGKITLSEAREWIAHFMIKGCEWICGGDYGSGDAQHYQNIVLAGVDENGKEVTNEVTYLFLDVLEELGISDFPTTVRLNRKTDERLLRRVAEVMRLGGGILAVYNEDLILASMTEYGYPLREARRFANDGCWEVQVPGSTFFIYDPFDALNILQKKTLKGYAEKLSYDSFDALYAQYIADVREEIEAIFQKEQSRFMPDSDGKVWKSTTPCTVVSLFEKGCIEKGCSYLEGGPVYNVLSPHIGGYPDAVNSLFIIKKIVYDEKRISLNDFISVLSQNWENAEPLRKMIQTRYLLYGNDQDEVDLIGRRLLDDFADACAALDGRCALCFPPGVSTFGRQIEWAQDRLASPHGYKKGAVLAANGSPTPGSNVDGVTAEIRSYCKADLKRMVTGAALDVKLLPSSVKGEEGLAALVALMRGFVALDGYFIQPDVADASVLREAQKHPEDYSTLSVRVSGWNARFVTLNECWQNMVIQEMEK